MSWQPRSVGDPPTYPHGPPIDVMGIPFPHDPGLNPDFVGDAMTLAAYPIEQRIHLWGPVFVTLLQEPGGRWKGWADVPTKYGPVKVEVSMAVDDLLRVLTAVQRSQLVDVFRKVAGPAGSFFTGDAAQAARQQEAMALVTHQMTRSHIFNKVAAGVAKVTSSPIFHAVVSAIPFAGPFLNMGFSLIGHGAALLSRAKGGEPDAQASVHAIVRAAKAGDPRAKRAFHVLRTLNEHPSLTVQAQVSAAPAPAPDDGSSSKCPEDNVPHEVDDDEYGRFAATVSGMENPFAFLGSFFGGGGNPIPTPQAQAPRPGAAPPAPHPAAAPGGGFNPLGMLGGLLGGGGGGGLLGGLLSAGDAGNSFAPFLGPSFAGSDMHGNSLPVGDAGPLPWLQQAFNPAPPAPSPYALPEQAPQGWPQGWNWPGARSQGQQQQGSPWGGLPNFGGQGQGQQGSPWAFPNFGQGQGQQQGSPWGLPAPAQCNCNQPKAPGLPGLQNTPQGMKITAPPVPPGWPQGLPWFGQPVTSSGADPTRRAQPLVHPHGVHPHHAAVAAMVRHHPPVARAIAHGHITPATHPALFPHEVAAAQAAPSAQPRYHLPFRFAPHTHRPGHAL